jgi:DNA polymerase III gamma/tau subunit
MYVPFVSKYEPKTLDEFELPDALRTSLNAVGLLARLNILLVGSSGTGKTAAAKAIATAAAPLSDILFINNVSENGIGFFRNEVRTFCRTNATKRKKVVVVDDIDVVNEQSQQVFRSTMDAFAASIQFIATATSEHRIVDGIASRFTTISLPPVTTSGMCTIMQRILTQEKLTLRADVRAFIIATSNLSPRVLLSTLDKLCLIGGARNLDECKQLCVAVDFSHYERLVDATIRNEPKEALDVADNMCAQGYSPLDVLDGFFHSIHLHPRLTETQRYETTKIISRYVGTCHACHTDALQLRLFVLEIFNVIRM